MDTLKTIDYIIELLDYVGYLRSLHDTKVECINEGRGDIGSINELIKNVKAKLDKQIAKITNEKEQTI